MVKRVRLSAPDDGGEPREDTPPKQPRQTSAQSKKPTPAQLEKELRGLFEIVAGGLMFADPAAGAWTEQKAPELARAWAIWAQKNAAVRRVLENLVAGGAAGNAVGVTAIWALGCYLIWLSRREVLPPAWAMAGGLFGVPIPGPDAPPEEPAKPGRVYEYPRPGGNPEGPPASEDVPGGHIGI